MQTVAGGLRTLPDRPARGQRRTVGKGFSDGNAPFDSPRRGQRQSLAATLSGAPSTMAPAMFARAIGYTDLSDKGNLRLSYSGDLGGGFIRFPVKPVAVMNYDSANDAYSPDYGRTIAKTDTRPVGTFLVGASVGLLWNLSRHFAISLDGRVLSGYPNWGVVAEGALSMQLALGGVRGPQTSEDENEGDTDNIENDSEVGSANGTE